MLLIATLLACSSSPSPGSGDTELGTDDTAPTLESTADTSAGAQELLLGEIRVLSSGSSDHHHATLAAHPDGSFFAAWAAGATVQVAAVDRNGAIAWQVEAPSIPSEVARKPDVVSTPAGALVAMETTTHALRALSVDIDGGLWAEPALLAPSTEPVTSVDLAGWPDGTTVASWYAGDTEAGGSEGRYQLRWLDTGVEWTVGTSAAGPNQPDVASRQDGSVVVVTTERLEETDGDGPWAVVEAQLVQADGTTVSVTVDRCGAERSPRPTVVVSEDGGFVVGWRRTLNGTTRVGLRAFDAEGRALTDVVSLPATEAPGPEDDDVGARAVLGWHDGRLLVVWDQPVEGTVLQILAMIVDPHTLLPLGSATPIGAEGAWHRRPDLALRDGAGLISWESADTRGTWSVHARPFTAPTSR
jgi:hypothetical protein